MEILFKDLDLKKETADNQVVLVVMTGSNYNELAIKIAGQLSKKKVGYVTLNKMHTAIGEMLKKNGISAEDFIYVDAISKTVIDVPDQTDGCYYVSSPAALTELSMAVSKVLNHDFEYLVFDSLTNLLVYSKKDSVAKFMQFLINKIKASDTRAIIYALRTGEQNDLVQEVSMFADKVIEVK